MQQTCESYYAIFDYASDAIFVLESETGAIVDLNNKAEQLYGYSRESVIKTDFGSLGAGRYPYDRQGALERTRRAAGGEEQVFEWQSRDRAGRIFWVEVNLKRVLIGGVDRILAVARDITRRKRTEQRLTLQYSIATALTEAASLAEATPLVLHAICDHVGWGLGEIWFVDALTGLLRFDGAWQGTTNEFEHFITATRAMTFSRGSGLPGRVWADGRPAWVTDVRTDPDFLRTAAAVAAGLHAAFAFPIKSAGEVLGILAFFSRSVQQPHPDVLEMFDALGSQIGDFIRRKKAEEELRRYAAELEKSNRELRMFASAASHDLQEPLRVITGFAALLERKYRGKLDGKADQYLHFMTDGTMRMQQLISDLLAYSRVANSRSRHARVDVNRALELALLNLKTAIEESGADVTCGPLPAVLGNESQLVSLLQNLVGNAIKYRGSRVPVVSIGAERLDVCPPGSLTGASSPGWLFSVRDNGIGIEQKYFDRIFQAFQRLHAREEYVGAGMGLAICKKIVERHGGRMWLESEPGKGSVFYFTMPDANPGSCGIADHQGK